MQKRRLALGFFLLAGLFLPAPARAYVDPGTGSYVLQLLIAGLLGALFALKVFWHKLVAFFKGLFGRPSRPSGSDNG